MIRLIRIGDQIEDGANSFSFFNTVNSKFIEIGCESVFESIDDLKEAMGCDMFSDNEKKRFISLLHNHKVV